MTLLLAALALADSGYPDRQGDFAVPSRTDAPTDAVLLFDANLEVTAEVVEGPGAPFSLDSEFVLAQLWGNESLVSFTHAWEAGATYRVVVSPQAEEIVGTGEITFTVGSEPAPAPSAPVIVRATASDWSAEPQEHVWGCCAYTRRLDFEVEATSDDPWAYVELAGLFEGDTQITEFPALMRLDVGIGPGAHTLGFTQWEEDGVPQPPAFEVTPVSSAGIRGEAVRVEFAEDLGEDVDTGAPDADEDADSDESRLCGTPVEAGLAPLALALLLASRRRSRGSSRVE